MAVEVGLRIRNKDGFVQIDGKYKNFKMVASGVVIPPALNNQTVEVAAPSGYVNTIIAVKCTDAACIPFNNGRGHRLLVASVPQSSASRRVEYFIFAETSNTASGGVGFQIRSSVSGQIVFNSNDQWLKVLGRYSGVMQKDQTLNFSFPAKKVAVVQAKRPYQVKSQRIIIQQQQMSNLSSYTGSIFPGLEHEAAIKFAPGTSGIGGPQAAYEYEDGTAEYFFVDVSGI